MTLTEARDHIGDAAVREERRQIELEQPHGNISLTARDHRLATATVSAARART